MSSHILIFLMGPTYGVRLDAMILVRADTAHTVLVFLNVMVLLLRYEGRGIGTENWTARWSATARSRHWSWVGVVPTEYTRSSVMLKSPSSNVDGDLEQTEVRSSEKSDMKVVEAEVEVFGGR